MRVELIKRFNKADRTSQLLPGQSITGLLNTSRNSYFSDELQDIDNGSTLYVGDSVHYFVKLENVKVIDREQDRVIIETDDAEYEVKSL